jgi:tRNA dimethylallyltransferase
LILFVVGPTASGKTDVVLELSRHMPIEVISCDSMQVYRGMPVLTQAPSAGVRRQVKHHLVECRSPKSEYNAAMFARDAKRLILAIQRRKKTPVFVGGTGLYVMALIDGLFEGPGEDAALREKLRLEAAKRGVGFLYKRLVRKDPEAAAKIHANDLRRIVRALEVIHLSKKKFSRLKKERRGIWDAERMRMYAFDWSRAELYARINERAERMFEQGLIDEVKKLGRRKLSKTASMCLGLREVQRYLAGELTLDAAKAAIRQNTRRYAKRQLSWFRRNPRILWIPVTSGIPAATLASRIYSELPNWVQKPASGLGPEGKKRTGLD